MSTHKQRIALIGMPNTGKSTFFNRITGANAKTGNWPGITVDVYAAKLILGDRVVEIVDLPGVYDFHGYSEDEAVVRTFLTTQHVNLVVLILNAVQIERQIQLAMQLKQLGIPVLLLLNMVDEARKLGMSIDADRLSARLDVPVCLVSARMGDGVPAALDRMDQLVRTPAVVDVTTTQFDELPLVQREQSQALLDGVIFAPTVLTDHRSTQIDRVMLHPWLGLPLFFLILYLMFQGVYSLGGPVQDLFDGMQGWVKKQWLVPLLAPLPNIISSFLLDGIWDGLITVATFVPVVIIFFWFVAVLEDTGYFSRVAFLMDAFMERLGLDGRSFVMVLMGFGCNVPALMGTRVMRSRGTRLLSMLVIPFSLCSARLQVFVFLIGLLFKPAYAGLALFSLYLLSVAAALLTALMFKKQFASSEPFILELPPYRLPTLQMLWRRSWLEVRKFLTRATKFITFGVVIIWLMTHLPWGTEVAGVHSYSGILGAWLAPIFEPIGIDAKLTISLFFGFIAKEIVIGALAIIYAIDEQSLGQQIIQQIDWVQAYSFMIFTLIYTPCLATLVTLRNEARSNKFMWFSLLWSLGLAWLLSFVFYQTARLLGF